MARQWFRIPLDRTIRHARAFSNKTQHRTLGPSLFPASLDSLRQHGPTFYTSGDHVRPLNDPPSFYTELKSRILNAKRRVFIAALYIGHTEQELIHVIRQALERNPNVEFHIVIDGLRGTRSSAQQQSSATLLAPLVRDFPGRFRISMYHTPDLNGMLKRLLPPRWNETIGLMHLKVYGFDDTVMLSGANLSRDYFTNRQDRYMIFDHQPHLATYYQQLLDTIGSLSYRLSSSCDTTGYRLTLPNGTADPIHEPSSFRRQARDRILNCIDSKTHSMSHNDEDTAIVPVVQMGPFGIRHDEDATLQLLQLAHDHQTRLPSSSWQINLTSGYFNFTDMYIQTILKTAATFNFLTAAPQANGFHSSRGVSRHLPAAYTFIERQFYRRVLKAQRSDTISIAEYNRPGWTYHAKGLWATLPEETLPSLTMIGSPNFGHRSSDRDLEAQAIVMTRNTHLRQALHMELDGLYHYATPVDSDTFRDPNRNVPWGVKVATTCIKTML